MTKDCLKSSGQAPQMLFVLLPSVRLRLSARAALPLLACTAFGANSKAVFAWHPFPQLLAAFSKQELPFSATSRPPGHLCDSSAHSSRHLDDRKGKACMIKSLGTRGC